MGATVEPTGALWGAILPYLGAFHTAQQHLPPTKKRTIFPQSLGKKCNVLLIFVIPLPTVNIHANEPARESVIDL